ncbi:MAG: DciA family protein [Phormidesmis sp.]
MALEGMGGLIKGLESQESWQVQRQFRLVLLHWPKAVGFAVARKTRPISIQRGTLYVATATASWAQTLSYERLTILKKLNRHQRQPLRSIRFSTAQWAQDSAIASSETAGTTEQSSETSRLASHPSYVGAVPSLPAKAGQTPQDAFQRWANALQEMQQLQSMCPICRCHCPQGELERWSRCGHCAAKRWQS